MTRCARAEQLGSPAAAPCLRAWARIALALVLLGIAGQASVAQAQEAALVQETPPAPAIDPEQLQGLVTTLEDPAARERFVAQLKALIASGKAAEPAGQAELEALGIDFAAELGARMHVFAASIARVALAMVDVPDMWRWLVAQAEAGTRNYWYEVVGKFTAVLLLGGLAHHLVRRLVVKAHDRITAPAAAGMFLRLRLLAARTILDLLPAAAFAAVSFGLLVLLGLGPAAEPVALALILATIGVQSVLLVARAILMPRTPSLRLLPVGDETAAYLYIWIKRFSHLVLYSYFLLQPDVLRMPRDILRGLTHLVGLVVALMLVIFVLQNREAVASWLRGGQAAEAGRVRGAFVAMRRFLANVWHLLAIAYLAGTYIVWSLHIPGGLRVDGARRGDHHAAAGVRWPAGAGRRAAGRAELCGRPRISSRPIRPCRRGSTAT